MCLCGLTDGDNTGCGTCNHLIGKFIEKMSTFRTCPYCNSEKFVLRDQQTLDAFCYHCKNEFEIKSRQSSRLNRSVLKIRGGAFNGCLKAKKKRRILVIIPYTVINNDSLEIDFTAAMLLALSDIWISRINDRKNKMARGVFHITPDTRKFYNYWKNVYYQCIYTNEISSSCKINIINQKKPNITSEIEFPRLQKVI